MLKPQRFQILLSLADADLHGLAIRDAVLEQTRGEMHLWPATLYRSLARLEEEGLIRETEPPRDGDVGPGQPRFYAITDRGEAVLRREIDRLKDYLATARAKNVGEA